MKMPRIKATEEIKQEITNLKICLDFDTDSKNLDSVEATNAYKCDSCNKVYKTKGSLHRHEKLNHQNLENGESVKENLDKIKRNLSTVHDKKSSKMTYNCDSCDKAYQIKWSLKRHKMEVHENLNKIVCDMCDYVCYENRRMKNHKNSKHAIENESNIYKCDNCSKSYGSSNSLRRHKEVTHLNIKNQFCQKCEYRCYDKKDMVRHIYLIHGCVKNYKRKMSKKTNSLSGNLKICHVGLKNANCETNVKKHVPIIVEREIENSRKNLLRSMPQRHLKKNILKAEKNSKSKPNFVDKSSNENIKIEKNNNKVKFPKNECGFCKKSFKYELVLQNHISKFHRIEVQNKFKSVSKLPNKRKPLMEVFENNDEKSNDEIFSQLFDLKTITRIAQDGSKIYNCDKCDQYFERIIDLNNHKSNNHTLVSKIQFLAALNLIKKESVEKSS